MRVACGIGRIFLNRAHMSLSSGDVHGTEAPEVSKMGSREVLNAMGNEKVGILGIACVIEAGTVSGNRWLGVVVRLA